MKAFTETNGLGQQNSELQGLYCEDVLRDWIQHLEEQVETTEQTQNAARIEVQGNPARQ